MDRLTFSGPFIPLQLGLLWYFLPPWVGIHTIWLVVWPEDALPVLFLLLAVLLLLALAALGGGGAFAYIKFIKPKQGAKVSADPDDYEFEDEEYENEDIPEQGEQEEQN